MLILVVPALCSDPHSRQPCLLTGHVSKMRHWGAGKSQDPSHTERHFSGRTVCLVLHVCFISYIRQDTFCSLYLTDSCGSGVCNLNASTTDNKYLPNKILHILCSVVLSLGASVTDESCDGGNVYIQLCLIKNAGRKVCVFVVEHWRN